ncbi:L,D-transpeptidase family protein [Dawidia soli]|uniref:L,D-transpeptidase family protein n=1 Tax=Dawidia soli TaxID=2782352 RepID=A0AAP2D741_9BACT|nr:L,D-transpeptidase family protein [Dawidia soli]MBT1686484.1 L,D-transpeptidase family protein [Dawidia soli]
MYSCKFLSACIVTVFLLLPGPGSPDARGQGILRMQTDTLDTSYHGLTVRSIRQFYARRQDQLFWTLSQHGTASADSLMRFIRQVRYYGLLPEWYHLPELEVLMQGGLREENACRFEALLTDAWILLVRHLRVGKTGAADERTDSLAVAWLDDAVLQGTLIHRLASIEPAYAGYRALKAALRTLIDSLPPVERELILANAVLASPAVAEQVAKLEINLERWRLERVSFGRRYIWINIPEFMAYVFVDDSLVLASKVIVGRPDKPTPELTSAIECLITYPYWHVPRKIAVEEYLPLIRQDVSFLRKNRFDVLDAAGNILVPDSLPWHTFTKRYFPVRLRQREGEDNALGVIKFEFDNPYGVYLHDTNARSLFRKDTRAFSHGCIRMEKAIAFSHYLVTGSLAARSVELDRYYNQSIRKVIMLKPSMPIYVRYFTCNVSQGSPACFPDLYRRDARLYRKFYMPDSRKTIGSHAGD